MHSIKKGLICPLLVAASVSMAACSEPAGPSAEAESAKEPTAIQLVTPWIDVGLGQDIRIIKDRETGCHYLIGDDGNGGVTISPRYSREGIVGCERGTQGETGTLPYIED